MLRPLLHRRTRLTLLAVQAWLAAVAMPQAAVVLDRVVAVVGDRPVMLSDVRAALDLELVDVKDAEDPAAAALAALIDRELMLIEVERYGPEAPPDAAVDAAVARVRERVGEARYSAALARSGLTDAMLAVVLRDDLRLQTYVSQRFGAAAQPTEEEVARAYTTRRDELASDGRVPTLAEAGPRLRERLAAERLAAQVADWLETLRRRTDVRVLDAPGATVR